LTAITFLLVRLKISINPQAGKTISSAPGTLHLHRHQLLFLPNTKRGEYFVAAVMVENLTHIGRLS